jgi:hypothetical protein
MKHSYAVKLTDSYLETLELSLGIEETIYDTRVN